MFLILGALGLVAFLIIFFLATYTVIAPNEAHVIVFMGRGRTIKSPVKKDGVDGKTSYFYIPFLMKRFVMPLTNVKLDITDISLNDKEMAPFECDVVTWLHIQDPVKAAERLDFSTGNVFASLHKDLDAVVQAVARASSMNQEILEIMKDRKTFSASVTAEVDPVLQSWGVQLVNLEVNEIRDTDGSDVIGNYEAIRKAAIDTKSRIEIATRNREAVEAEQENLQKSEVAKAQAEKVFTEKQIETAQAIGIRTQEKEQFVAKAAQETNKQKVEALRVSTVGQADVDKQASITKATGEGEAIRIRGEKEANVVSLKGKADGDAIEAKGLAEAKAKDAMAEALKKFNDAGINLEQIKAYVEIQKGFAEAYGKIAANADIKVVTGGEGGNILGLPMNASTGANIGQMVEAFGGMDKIKEMFSPKV